MRTNTKRIIVKLLVLLIATTLLRLVWIGGMLLLDEPVDAAVETGQIDLRGQALSDYGSFRIEKGWDYYPDHLIPPSAFTPSAPTVHTEAAGYGTYRLVILLDDTQDRYYAMRFQRVQAEMEVYVNGHRAIQSGTATTSDLRNGSGSFHVVLIPENNRLDVVIHAKGGEWTEHGAWIARFGSTEAIRLRVMLTGDMQLLIAAFLLVNAVYVLIIRLLGTKDVSLLYLFAILLFGMGSVLVDDDRLLFSWLSLGLEWENKSFYLTYGCAILFMPLYFNSLFPGYRSARYLRGYGLSWLVFLCLVIFTPVGMVEYWKWLAFVALLWSVHASFSILWRATRANKDIGLLLAAILCLTVNTAWGFVDRWMQLDYTYYPLDFLLALLLLSTFWFKRHFQTVAQEKALSQRLQEEEKRKDAFLTTTSHELRNPLHVMINLTRLVLDDARHPLHQEHREKLDLFMHAGRRLMLMLDDLLDVARLREQTIRLQYSQVDVKAVVNHVLDMAKWMTGNKEIVWHNEVASDLPTLWADENRVVQILFNLVHNAVKYTDSGSIMVRAAHAQDWITLEVEDTGIGMDDETMRRIFELYAQADNEAAASHGGYGIGLNISRQLAELHGGTLHVQSRKGLGTIFSCKLPNAAALGNDQPAVAAAAARTAGEAAIYSAHLSDLSASTDANGNDRARVLVVDDDPVNVYLLADMLRTEGYRIYTAGSAYEAMETLDHQEIDLVISDVMMPGMSGYALTRKLRERYEQYELPVLLLTARNRPDDIATGFHAGANDYLKKPVEADELKARVRMLSTLKISLEERLRLEGAWLQLQIEPHFVLNTLNAIASLGLTDYEKMQKLLGAFGDYLRLSFDFHNTQRLVPIERELDLLSAYLYVEQERFGDRLQVELAWEPSDQFQVPPLSIQPLVENAIRHGIMRRIRGGTIRIMIVAVADGFQVEVQDDGIGISADRMPHLLDRKSRDHAGTGIGLRNIDLRLKQCFGQGLTIDSMHDSGTKVSFHIPHNHA